MKNSKYIAQMLLPCSPQGLEQHTLQSSVCTQAQSTSTVISQLQSHHLEM